ncbi:MAG: hypothetical protein JWM16_2785 [Verrucomicrobiales bacterium]|nr:hypothetical protein [Verrucomicrobiales bacterium]
MFRRLRAAGHWVFLALLFCGFSSPVFGASSKRAAAPVFSEARGIFEKPFSLELTSKTAGAKIYFTTNGSAPEEGKGTLYRGTLRVASTTVLRAVAIADGLAPSEIVTESYLFLPDVVKQAGSGFPTNWGVNLGKAVPADYEIDPEITGHPDYRDQMLPALQAIPMVSVVMEVEDLFGSKRGIYANPKESGAEWERPASVELMFPKGEKGFRVGCGIRIQGGWNRRPEESPKHSFRLLFKKKYGPGKLKFPLFGAGGEFDTLILRGGCNNTWLHWSGEERKRGDFIRDQWMRDSLREMGHPSAHGFFVHLYLNGLYWGLYNLCERPSAPFVAAHFGGKPEDYDVRNGDHILEGDGESWKKMMSLANAGVKTDGEFAAIAQKVDMPELVDYLILNFYGANADWDHASNWYAARRRSPAGKFEFFVWDGERTLEGVTDNSMAFDDDQSPPRLFHKLKENPEFRRLFGERARLHLINGGALSPAKAAERYRKWVEKLDLPVIAESARWGDYRRDVHRYKTGPYELYTRKDHWRPEVDRLLNQYFPKRSDAVLKQFEERGLYRP